MSAGLPNSTQVLIFGFITSGGQKMSKSLGNTVNPFDLVKKYSTDAVRYYLLADLTPYEDSDYTEEKFAARYTADLANGIGNLVSRTANMIEKEGIRLNLKPNSDEEFIARLDSTMAGFQFDQVMKVLWDKFRSMDEFLTAKAPWKMEDKKEKEAVLIMVAQNILNAAYLLKPFLPATAEKIIAQFSAKGIKKGDGLFPRLA
jgi:methionyl-tRNA synthetase